MGVIRKSKIENRKSPYGPAPGKMYHFFFATAFLGLLGLYEGSGMFLSTVRASGGFVVPAGVKAWRVITNASSARKYRPLLVARSVTRRVKVWRPFLSGARPRR